MSSLFLGLLLCCIQTSLTAAGELLCFTLAVFHCVSDDHVENTWELIM